MDCSASQRGRDYQTKLNLCQLMTYRYRIGVVVICIVIGKKIYEISQTIMHDIKLVCTAE